MDIQSMHHEVLQPIRTTALKRQAKKFDFVAAYQINKVDPRAQGRQVRRKSESMPQNNILLGG